MYGPEIWHVIEGHTDRWTEKVTYRDGYPPKNHTLAIIRP